ncbi:cupin domain-containing protein [Acetobacter estunensis]|nr:cupin domain-containing protein [Acetobacter estunensis]MBV1836813.1 cupin domain-containing protein [Acetobacter estunensis]
MTESLAHSVRKKTDVSVADILVGRRIRALRLEKGLSLSILSARAGISVGALSQIERGLSSLRIRTIWPLATALCVDPQDLVAEGKEPQRDVYCVPASARKTLPIHSDGIIKSLLSPHAAALTGMLVCVEVGGASGMYAHSGNEFGYVLSGELMLWIEGASYRLSSGDSFAFRSNLEHSFRNCGTEVAKILWVNTSKPEKE